MDLIAGLQSEAVWNVGEKRAATGAGVRRITGIIKSLKIETRLSIPKIQVVRRQQVVPFRADVADLEDKIFRKLALEGDVVLIGGLRLELGWHLSEQQNRTEERPVDVGTGGRQQ